MAKNILFIGTSRSDLRSFPLTARRKAGYQLDRLKRGMTLKIGSQWQQLEPVLEK